MSRSLVFLLAILLVGTCGCRRQSNSPSVAEKPKNESDLALVTISAQAYKSLGIDSQPLKTGSVQEHLALTGWIMAKQGHEVTLTAPVAGYVRLSPKMKRSPQGGETVAQGQVLFAIEPVLSPVEHIQMAALRRSVDSELTKAKESVSAAKKEFDRVKVLYDQKLRGDQELEQAQVKFRHADEDLKTAKDKLKLFEMPERSIASPRAGTIVTVPVSPGQYVAAAAPLITIVDLTHVWVRVPVPEFDLPQVNVQQPVTLTLKNNGADAQGAKAWANYFRATPVALVPQVDPVRHTADLIYEVSPFAPTGQREGAALAAIVGAPLAAIGILPSQRAAFAKDQMVTVFVPLGQKRTESVVPYSAIVFDAFGGAWIYLDRTDAKANGGRFERRRVELGPTVDGGVIIRPAAATTDRVVIAGAAALYSREFHSPPVAGGHKQKVDDDD